MLYLCGPPKMEATTPATETVRVIRATLPVQIGIIIFGIIRYLSTPIMPTKYSLAQPQSQEMETVFNGAAISFAGKDGTMSPPLITESESMVVTGLMGGTILICIIQEALTGIKPTNPRKKETQLRLRYWQTHFGWMAGRWRIINLQPLIREATTPAWPGSALTDMTVVFA